MIKKFSEFKTLYNKLGNYTRFIIKTALTFVLTCLFASFVCFVLKDFSDMYIFLYRVSEELLIVARSCFSLGILFSIIGYYSERK